MISILILSIGSPTRYCLRGANSFLDFFLTKHLEQVLMYSSKESFKFGFQKNISRGVLIGEIYWS
jgi:hypothetical protein